MMTDRTAAPDADLLTLDPVAWLWRDPLVAEKAWNRMGHEAQIRYWLAAPFAARAALCELAHDIRTFVPALPPQEVWITIQTTGGADAMALFRYASPEQVQFCFDVECWAKDRWVPTATFEWLRLVAACGGEKIVEFFGEIDEQLLGLLLKRWLCVYVRIADEDIGEAIPWPLPDAPVTLDGVVYFQVVDAQVDDWFRPMLEWYGKHEPDLLRQLLLQIPALSTTEQEELAYQTRARRLAEYGFPEWDEAVAVYRRLPSEEFGTIPRRHGVAASRESDTAPLGFSLVPLHDTELLLRDALARVEAGVREAAATELARLANRVLIADGHAISFDHTQQTLCKAIAYVNLGLEQLSGGDPQRAAQVVRDHWLTGLFQIGFSLVMQLADTVRTWLAAHPLAPEADDPTTAPAVARERLRAAAWRWPKFYVGPQSPDGVLHRDFRTTQELATVRQAMT